jgi:uncharacterized protein YndB with AHSA1/START domain
MADDAVAQGTSRQVVVETEIAVPPDRVFQALLEVKDLEAWWSEEGAQREVRWEIEPRVGGRWRSTGNDDGSGNWEMHGEIVILDRPRVLAYTWEQTAARGHGSGGRTLVRYDLTPTATGTRVRVTHSGFGNAEAIEAYRGGWPTVVEMLRRHCEARR